MATVRTLDAYSIHGHLAAGSPGEELLDYPSFFDALAARGVGRSLKVGTETVGPVDYVDLGGRMAFRFISGNDAESAEAYDPTTGTTVPVELGRERFIVSSAWVVVDPEARILILERKRPGVPVYQLERYLSGFGRDEGFDRLSVSLNPVPSPSFVEEILSFDRIREASITIRRPNHSFTESAREAVAQIARDSNAGSATVQVNAERKGVSREGLRDRRGHRLFREESHHTSAERGREGLSRRVRQGADGVVEEAPAKSDCNAARCRLSKAATRGRRSLSDRPH